LVPPFWVIDIWRVETAKRHTFGLSSFHW